MGKYNINFRYNLPNVRPRSNSNYISQTNL